MWGTIEIGSPIIGAGPNSVDCSGRCRFPFLAVMSCHSLTIKSERNILINDVVMKQPQEKELAEEI
jgi:hypothetical protein